MSDNQEYNQISFKENFLFVLFRCFVEKYQYLHIGQNSTLSCARLVWEILWKKIKAHTPFSTGGGAVLPEAGPPEVGQGGAGQLHLWWKRGWANNMDYIN